MVKPTHSVTQDEICDTFQQDLTSLQRPHGILSVEGVLLFGEEFERGTLMCFQPKGSIPEGSIEWSDRPDSQPTLHQAIMVMSERIDPNEKEMRILMGKRILWIHEGENVILSVLTQAGSKAHKGIWRSLRRIAKRTSQKIQILASEDALIQNVKNGYMVCHHDTMGNDLFRLTPEGIKHVEEM